MAISLVNVSTLIILSTITFGHVLDEAVVYPVGGRVLPAYARAAVASSVAILSSAPRSTELTSSPAYTPGPAPEGLGQLTEA